MKTILSGKNVILEYGVSTVLFSINFAIYQNI